MSSFLLLILSAGLFRPSAEASAVDLDPSGVLLSAGFLSCASSS